MQLHGKLNRAESKAAPMRGPAQERGRDFTQYMTDLAITETLESVLAAQAGIDSRRIDVETYHNTVTLTGEVATPAERKRIAQLVANRDNAERVINQLRVRPSH